MRINDINGSIVETNLCVNVLHFFGCSFCFCFENKVKSFMRIEIKKTCGLTSCFYQCSMRNCFIHHFYLASIRSWHELENSLWTTPSCLSIYHSSLYLCSFWCIKLDKCHPQKQFYSPKKKSSPLFIVDKTLIGPIFF